MKKIILYARGKDKPGIISKISKEISSFNANIETSKMIKLETYFNILSLIEIKESDINNLENKLNEIDDLSIEISNIKNSAKKYNNIFFFQLKGADNEGIVYKFTNYFFKNDINIQDLETEIINAPITGQQLFLLKSKILIPKNIDIEIIKNELIELSNMNNVAIKFEKYDNSMDY